MPGSEAPRWRFLITPKWLAWHLIMVASVYGMLALGDWQLHRAMAGNGLSWAYTFEWPIFAVFGVVFWAKTILDEFRPPVSGAPGDESVALPAGAFAAGAASAATASAATASAGAPAGAGSDGDEDADLAAYNAYLARLHGEVKGHGRWHGLR